MFQLVVIFRIEPECVCALSAYFIILLYFSQSKLTFDMHFYCGSQLVNLTVQNIKSDLKFNLSSLPLY